MLKNKKNWICHVLTMCLVLSVNFSFSQGVAEEVRSAQIDGITWYYRIVDDDAVVERGRSGKTISPAIEPSAKGHLRIPSSINGHKVRAIGYGAFYRCDSIISIEIPEGVESVSQLAFAWCNALKKIDFPDSLKMISFDSFLNCENLTSLNLKNIQEIRELGIIGNKAERISVSATNNKFMNVGDCLLMKGGGIKGDETALLFYPRVAKKGSRKRIKIPSSVWRIGYGACAYVDAEEVNIGGRVRSIGNCAFLNSCIRQVRIGKNVKEVHSGAFSYCFNLQSVHFYSGTKIASKVFDKCKKLKRIVFWGDAPIDVVGGRWEDVLAGTPKELEIVVKKGSRGWDVSEGGVLPNEWPVKGGDNSRAIRYGTKDEFAAWGIKRDRVATY